MATIEYQCDTCKREIELLENRQGLTILNKCVITEGCRGKLFKIKRNPYNIRESLPESSISNLNDYFPRRVFFEFSQDISSTRWLINHNMGINPSIVVYFFNENDKPFIVDVNDYNVNIINDNTLEILFEEPQNGLVHLIARNTKNITPITIPVMEDLHKIEYNGTLSLGIINKFFDQINSIKLEISLQEPNQEEIFCEEEFNDNVFSPWSNWNQLLLRKRRNYIIRSKNILDFIVFQERYESLSEIPNGTRLRIHRISINNDPFMDIVSKTILILLANSPYQQIDKDLNRIVDVGEIAGSSMVNYYTFVNGELFVNTNQVENTFPKIERAS